MTATEAFRIRIDQLHKTTRSLVDLKTQLLEEWRGACEDLRRVRAVLENELSKGTESIFFTQKLKEARELVLYAEASPVLSAPLLADWPEGAQGRSAFKREAETLLAWIDGLLTQLARPWVPIDISKLPSPPAAPAGEAPGYISIDEARARLRERRKA
ncbi:MAG: hypothetical protein HYS12_09370 [Planctomycetes bacterium]|nr:hypothetical protein [Planctomycetota bacterium]